MNTTTANTHRAAFKRVSETEWINTKCYCPLMGLREKAYLGPPSHRKNGLKRLWYETTPKRNICACFVAWGSSAFDISSRPPQARIPHTAAASGALRLVPNPHFCHQFNCKLMILQKLFQNPRMPFCAVCTLIRNLNEIFNLYEICFKIHCFFL